MSKIILFIISFLSFSILSFSQGFEVNGFQQSVNDGSAFHAPLDTDGHSCGLIKVRTDNAELQFKGDIVGDVENKMNEYWVFVTQGCNSLKVCHPNFMPLVVSFQDYGIDISPKATYILTLKATKYKKEKAGLNIITKPEDANLYIDDVFIDNLSGNGFYQMYLPKGEHVCKLSKTGYRPNVQVVQTGKASQNINVELESVMAELEIKSKTATAEIYVDSELKGNGTWKGELVAGEHMIEARQQNFNSHSQAVILAEKEKRTLVVPELKRSMAKLKIKTIPNSIPVIVDGQSVGISPCEIDVVSGKHNVVCKTYGCLECRRTIEVESSKLLDVKIEMEYTAGFFQKEKYKKAYEGNIDTIVQMIEEIAQKSADTPNFKEFGLETVFWMNRLSDRKVYYDIITNKEKMEIQNDPEFGGANMQSYLETVILGKIFSLIKAYCNAEKPEGAGIFLEDFLSYERAKDYGVAGLEIWIGDAYYKRKEIDKAITYYNKAIDFGTYGSFPAYEGLGDCYKAKGEKQRAATHYKKCLNLDYYDGKNRVEKKLKDLGY